MDKHFAEYLGVNHVVSVNSGCAAIHVALMAAGVKAGDEVIVPPYTWGQTVSPILQTNAIPVFADIDPETFNLDPAAVEARVSPHTKAVVVVHLCGGPAKMDAIMDVAERHGLMVIEDCAQAIGASYKGKGVGAWGHLGAFSIGNGKNLAAGDGCGASRPATPSITASTNSMGHPPVCRRRSAPMTCRACSWGASSWGCSPTRGTCTPGRCTTATRPSCASASTPWCTP